MRILKKGIISSNETLGKSCLDIKDSQNNQFLQNRLNIGTPHFHISAGIQCPKTIPRVCNVNILSKAHCCLCIKSLCQSPWLGREIFAPSTNGDLLSRSLPQIDFLPSFWGQEHLVEEEYKLVPEVALPPHSLAVPDHSANKEAL